MERITRSVRDFVLPLEPSGSLDASLSFQLEEDAAAQGTRLHAKVQKRLGREHPDVQSERAVLATLEREGFECVVRGRIDVLLPGPPPILEEIKTTFQPQRLLRALAADPAHPFAQQVRMYAWIHARTSDTAPTCRLRVISLLDEAETLVDVPFDLASFTTWVEAQVEGLHAQHLRALARAAERKAVGEGLAFPFEAPRPGQTRLLHVVEEALEAGEPLLVQAPTGLGKTAAVLYPGLQKALAEDLRAFYLTPRNSQHAVAEAFVRRLVQAGHPVRSVTLRAKERVCPQDEVHCHPDACPRAKGYYDRLKESKALDRIAGLGCADSPAIQALADEHALCPFELSLDAARNADVIIGDYNYALSPSATLMRFFGEKEAEARNLLLIDEAHNLPNRATAWFSPALELAQLQGLKKAWKGKRTSLKGRFTRQVDRCLALVAAHEGPNRKLDLDPLPFTAEEKRIRELIAKATSDGVELAPGHALVQLFRLWSDFCAVLRERTDAHLLTWTPPGRLQITCVDASSHLADRFESLAGAVLFSGTLKPFDFYARLSGLAEPRCEEIPSPFPAEHRRLLMVPQVSTLYRRRDQETPRIAEFLSRVLPLRHGNYLVFFPSFEFLEKTLPFLDLPEFRILAQPRRATPEALDRILAALASERGLVVLAVQGGSLSEGIDLPGDALIGSVIVGPPIPPFDLERRLTKEYFDRSCGQGEAYTYVYPAMAKAVQAAGRVIRGPEERGLLAFLDPRFLEPAFAECFPRDWFQDSPWEGVSDRILADVTRFWARG
ncbi:ATP-dependent DNA helicase [Geothrix sp. 21YS21S-4]|uniref:ATP-dependent DNA helicase n=1 Tax=Geothrix sp. 21YS21S-4 TaxID=3068889 RepID=UPI0027B8C23E|nr:ATP-dependent DNA helicase [Geothrix sp. 21YS21S-4]